jgi:hypothetical protein
LWKGQRKRRKWVKNEVTKNGSPLNYNVYYIILHWYSWLLCWLTWEKKMAKEWSERKKKENGGYEEERYKGRLQNSTKNKEGTNEHANK